MPRLSASVSEPLVEKIVEKKAPQTDLDRGVKNFHRLYTDDEDSTEPTQWEFKHSKHEFAPHIDTGFNPDGTIIVPDAPTPGFDPKSQLFRWPDGVLRHEYPPRDPYVVAARRSAEKLVRYCRFNDPEFKTSENFRHRYNVGVLWCAHARYCNDKLGFPPETNASGEYYGYESDDTFHDPVLLPDHPVNKFLAAKGVSYADLVEEEERLYIAMITERFNQVREGRGNESQLINKNIPEGERRFVPFRTKELGRMDPAEDATPRTGLDELE